jgi:hypothetical protein
MAVNKKDTLWLLEAEKFAKRYLSLMPNGYRSYEYLGTFYRSMIKDERLAIRYYESAIRWKDAETSTHHSLIALCLKNNDLVKAKDYCLLTLKRYPKDAYANMRLKDLDAR